MMTYLKHDIQKLTELVQQNMSSKCKDSDDFQWDVNGEILFLHSLFGLKPVGVNRFFIMREIHSRFSNFVQRELYSKVLWDHLSSMFDIAVLHESENLPFPNEETPFELSKDFDDLVKEKFGVTLTHSTEENNSPKDSSDPKESKKTTKLKQMLPPVTNSKNTPGTVKSSKSTDSRPPSIEAAPKARSESKTGKVKRSSSPFVARIVKPEPNTVVKEEPADSPSVRKSSKVENSSSGKKTPKPESVATPASTKKSVKHEPNAGLGRVKTEAAESSGKKVRAEKEVASKKGRVSATTESSSSRKSSAESSSSKKSSKGDGKNNDTDKLRKSADATSQKTKSERNSTASSKSSKQDGLESPVPSGSKKHSVGKVDVNDKKRRRSKVDDSAKKTPVTKRRRT